MEIQYTAGLYCRLSKDDERAGEYRYGLMRLIIGFQTAEALRASFCYLKRTLDYDNGVSVSLDVFSL